MGSDENHAPEQSENGVVPGFLGLHDPRQARDGARRIDAGNTQRCAESLQFGTLETFLLQARQDSAE